MHFVSTSLPLIWNIFGTVNMNGKTQVGYCVLFCLQLGRESILAKLQIHTLNKTAEEWLKCEPILTKSNSMLITMLFEY